MTCIIRSSIIVIVCNPCVPITVSTMNSGRASINSSVPLSIGSAAPAFISIPSRYVIINNISNALKYSIFLRFNFRKCFILFFYFCFLSHIWS